MLETVAKPPNLSHPLFDMLHQRFASTVPSSWDATEGGITALEKALGPSLDSILLSRPVTCENSWRVCVWCEKRKHNILSFCLLLLLTSNWKGIAFCSVSVNFQIQILCFLDSLIVRWQLGRVRGSQFLANLSSPQLTLHSSHEN